MPAAAPPGLVCLDEPTRGLDRERKAALVAWLRGLAAGTGEEPGAAVIVATHDVEFAAELTERVVLLGRGRVLADGSAARMLAGGWYFATEVARITNGGAIAPAAGAALLASAADRRGAGSRPGGGSELGR